MSMFGRKKPDSPKGETARDDAGAMPLKLRNAQPSAPAAAAATPTNLVAPVQPRYEIPRRPTDAAPPRPAAAAPPPPPRTEPVRASASEGKKLLVGRDIMLSGEITMCDQLVVEGKVQAALSESREIEICEAGSFKGTAEIDDAEVRGIFEGDLLVRNRLLIRSTGKVTGNVRYGMLEIECGGQISGDIQIIAGQQPQQQAAPPARAASKQAPPAPESRAVDPGDEESWQIPAR